MKIIRVMLADDHAMLRAGLRLLVDAQEDMQVVAEAGTFRHAVDEARRSDPDVVTIDLSMPGATGIKGIEQLRAAVPRSRLLVVTMHDDPAYVRAAMACGAAGYVVKSAADSELITAIRAVAKGRVFIDLGNAAMPEAILAPTVVATTPPDRAPVDTLSEREREVLCQVARGYTNQQIADEIGLSVKTVESYRARLMKKLNLRERADLVRLVKDLGLL